MVIKLKRRTNNVPAPNHEFTMGDIDYLFSQTKDWKKFYEEHESDLWESKIDVYKWVVFPLHLKEDQFYRCILHPFEEVKNGVGKPKIIKFENIHYAEFISHCIYYKPEEHKQYIIEKLFGSHHVSGITTTTTTTDQTTASQ